VYPIGYIQTATPDEQAYLTKAFEEGLRDLGYVEGRSVVFERRFAWEDSALKLGMTVQVVEVRGRDELEGAFAAIVRARADAVVVDSDPVFFTARSRIVQLAMKHQLSAVYQALEFVKIGGLMSYGDNVSYRFRGQLPTRGSNPRGWHAREAWTNPTSHVRARTEAFAFNTSRRCGD
jgi:hypothetical protein